MNKLISAEILYVPLEDAVLTLAGLAGVLNVDFVRPSSSGEAVPGKFHASSR